MHSDELLMARLHKLLHKLMLGLFYPAVLGTVFYSYFPYIRNYKAIPGKPAPFIISLCIIIHFLADYVYTEHVKKYTLGAFFSDLLILFMIYLAFDSLSYLEHAIDYHTLSISLAIIYLLFIYWDFSLKREMGHFWLLIVYEVIALVFYIASVILSIAGITMVIGTVIATFLAIFFAYKSIGEMENRKASGAIPITRADLAKMRPNRTVQS